MVEAPIKTAWSRNNQMGVNYSDYHFGHIRVLVDETQDGELWVIGMFSSKPGSGELGELMDYLEGRASLMQKRVRVCEIWNERLYKHLIEKRGYEPIDKVTVIR